VYDRYPIETEELIRALLGSFESDIPRCASGGDSLRDWTNVVKSTLRRLGKQRSLDVYDGTPSFEECLVDVMWWNESSFRPEAVFESEWGNVKEVMYDFQKLIFIKAPLKVLICGPEDRAYDLIPRADEWIQKYPDHVMGERYVIVNVRRGTAECYQWAAPRNGGVGSEARFLAVPGSPFRYG
jgi:hypothetical protein